MGGCHQTHPEMMITQKSGQPWAPWSQHMKPTITEANTFDVTDAAWRWRENPGEEAGGRCPPGAAGPTAAVLFREIIYTFPFRIPCAVSL